MVAINGDLTLSGSVSLSNTPGTNTLDSLVDDFSINHVFDGRIPNILIESLTIDDQVVVGEITTILESISMATVVLTNGSTYHAQIQEAIQQADLVKGIAQLIITEGITLDDVLNNYRLYQNVVQEVCTLNDIPFSTGVFNIALAVSFTLSDFMTDLNEILVEGITVDEAFLEVLFLTNLLLEEVSVGDTVNNILTVYNLIVEQVTSDETTSTSGVLNSSVTEDVSFIISAALDGIVYEGWLINPETFAVWNYNNFDFNSVTAFDDRYLMASQAGLFELEGSFDDGEYIISKIKTSSLDFGTSNLKQVSDVILGVVNSGRLVLKVSVDGDQTTYYELKPGSRNLSNQKIKIGKGLYGRYWQFELITKDNSSLDLDSFEVLPFIFKRKFR